MTEEILREIGRIRKWIPEEKSEEAILMWAEWLGKTMHPAAIRPLLEARERLLKLAKTQELRYNPNHEISEALSQIRDELSPNHPDYRRMQLAHEYLRPNDRPEVALPAIQHALRKPKTFQNPKQARLFIKHLRAMHGRLK